MERLYCSFCGEHIANFERVVIPIKQEMFLKPHDWIKEHPFPMMEEFNEEGFICPCCGRVPYEYDRNTGKILGLNIGHGKPFYRVIRPRNRKKKKIAPIDKNKHSQLTIDKKVEPEPDEEQADD